MAREARKDVFRRSGAAIGGLATAFCLACAPARASEPTLTLFVVSDRVERGTTETVGQPSVGVEGEWAFDEHAFVGAAIEQARDRDEVARQRQTRATLHAGLARAVGRRHVLSTTVARRTYPSAEADWDYTEFAVELAARDGFGAALSFSPDYYDRGAAATAFRVGYRRALGLHGYAYGDVGGVRFADDVEPSHVHARIGVGRSWQALNVELQAFWNDEGRDGRFGSERYSDPGLLLALAWRVY